METIYMAGPWITEHEISVVEDVMRNGWYDPDDEGRIRYDDKENGYDWLKSAEIT